MKQVIIYNDTLSQTTRYHKPLSHLTNFSETHLKWSNTKTDCQVFNKISTL